jgi:uncharacterized membrane protein
MNAMTLLPLAALFVLIDLPWLWASSAFAQPMFKRVQGGLPLEIRWPAAPVVYLALAYLMQQTRSLTQAIGMGLAVYAVYDFTNLATLSRYDATFALADTLWGGALFGLVRTAAVSLNLL